MFRYFEYIFPVKLFIGEFCGTSHYRIQTSGFAHLKEIGKFVSSVSLLVHRFLMLDYCSVQFEEPGKFGFDP